MMTEVMLASAVFMAYKRAGKQKELSGERKEIYEKALEYLTDPDKLRKLADSFQKNGYKLEAMMLRKRADLRALPKEIKERNKEILEKALKSQNIDAVLRLADEFDKLTATGAAKRLRAHVEKLQQANGHVPFDVIVKQVKTEEKTSKKKTKREEPKKDVIDVKPEEVPKPAPTVQQSAAIHGDGE
jgi:predicted ATP-grasp superfamily ATP-dependent carboligase